MATKKDTRTGLPKHEELYHHLRGKIEPGAYLPGTRLPPRRELSDDFVLARGTVIRVLQRPVDKGAFAPRASGSHSHYVVLKPAALRLIPASNDVAKKLGVPLGTATTWRIGTDEHDNEVLMIRTTPGLRSRLSALPEEGPTPLENFVPEIDFWRRTTGAKDVNTKG